MRITALSWFVLILILYISERFLYNRYPSIGPVLGYNYSLMGL